MSPDTPGRSPYGPLTVGRCGDRIGFPDPTGRAESGAEWSPADATLEVGAIPASPTAEQQIRIEALRTADNRLPVVVGGLVNDDTDAVLNLADQYAHWITHGPVVDDDPSPVGLYQWRGEQGNPDE